jgi:hypothetical protein
VNRRRKSLLVTADPQKPASPFQVQVKADEEPRDERSIKSWSFDIYKGNGCGAAAEK